MDNSSINISKDEKKQKVRKYGEVFTPSRIVSQMCDMLENESPGCFAPNTTFLEPTCGDGVFVCEILRRKFERCEKRTDYTVALDSVYAMEIQADNVERCIDNVLALCEQYFSPTKEEREIVNDHVILCDSLKVMKLLNRWNPVAAGNFFT